MVDKKRELSEEQVMQLRDYLIMNMHSDENHLSQIVLEKGYLITSVLFVDENKIFPKNRNLVYTIIDATSKQDEHLLDFPEYTNHLYSKFMETNYGVNGERYEA